MDTGFLSFLLNALRHYDISTVNPVTLVQVVFWLFAALISFYFSLGNARVWTSISTGFFLIFWSQAYSLNPWQMFTKLVALHYIIGTISILLIAFGFLEYYIFSRTLEITGTKRAVYLTTCAVILLTWLILLINPKPTDYTLRNLKMIDNAIWVFLSIFIIDILRKIYFTIKDSAIANGFIAFGIVFFLVLIWKGSELYLQVFQWDPMWTDMMEFAGEASDAVNYPGRVGFASKFHTLSGYLSGLTVGGTFLYLFKLLR